MRRLDRYVLKEMIVPLIAGTVVIAFLFMANELIYVFKEFNLSSVPRSAVAKYIFLSLPKWFFLTFPMGVTFGASLAISRLAREGEMTAMRAAGYSVWRIFRMVAVCGVAYAGLSFYNSSKVTPWAGKESEKLLREVGVLAAIPTFERNQSINLPPYSANFGMVEKRDETLYLTDILLIERPKEGQVYIYSAKTGEYSKGVWRIQNPDIRVIEGESLIMVNRVKELVINQRIVLQDFLKTSAARDRSTEELWRDILDGRTTGINTRSSEIEFYSRYAVASTCFGFAIMGAVLAFRFRRGSAFQGFLISLITVWIYFNLQIVATEVLGKNAMVSPMVAAWIPVAVIGVLTLIASWRLE